MSAEGKKTGGAGPKISAGAWLWVLLAALTIGCAALVLILLLGGRKSAPETASVETVAVETAAPKGEQPGLSVFLPAEDSEEQTPSAAAPVLIVTPEPATEPFPVQPSAPTTAPTTAPVQVPVQPSVPTTAPVQVPVTSPLPFSSGYLDDAARLENKGLEQLCRVMEDTIAYNVRTTWGTPEHLDRSEYVGFYLLAAKTEDTWPRNILVLVYRNDVTVSIPAEKVNKSLSYYFSLRFENVWAGEDGSLTLYTPQQPTERVNANIPNHNFYYSGYGSLDSLYKVQIEPSLGKYSLSQRFPRG